MKITPSQDTFPCHVCTTPTHSIATAGNDTLPLCAVCQVKAIQAKRGGVETVLPLFEEKRNQKATVLDENKRKLKAWFDFRLRTSQPGCDGPELMKLIRLARTLGEKLPAISKNRHGRRREYFVWPPPEATSHGRPADVKFSEVAA